ncbi:hypothetical protein HEK616_43670 [Streptomyces nigrescens]|uniref:Uncharacterized protein n=1 Tax=Streptomyces nigrescens TaxID=1920 RepID=A0ABN6R1A5_STRNI|nr:hypothetical protein HEK616_43670 [Streptomyces nigrescens]
MREEGAQGERVGEHVGRQLCGQLLGFDGEVRALCHVRDEVGALGTGHRRHQDMTDVGGVDEVLGGRGQDQARCQPLAGAWKADR